MSPKRACDICYRRKIQCLIPEAGVPCDWCRHHDSQCTFNREAPRKSKQNRLKLTDVHDLYQRIQHLESALAQATAQPLGRDDALNFVTPTSCSVETPASSATPAATELTPASHSVRETEFPGLRQSPSSVTSIPASDFPCFASHIGPNWFFRGIHAFSEEGRQWISSRTGQTVDLRKLRLFTSNYAPSTNFSSAFPGVSSLPDKQVLRELASSFLMSPLWLSFPVIDRFSFDETLDIAYGTSDDRPNSPTQLAALASVWGILSLMSHCKDLGNGYSGIDANDCTNKARQLYTHSTLAGHWQEAGFYLPLACSMVSALGGHTSTSHNTPDDGTTLSAKKRLHLRNLFWICYVADKDMALRTGRPPLLSAVFYDVSIPKDYDQHYAYLRSFDEPVDRLSVVGDGPVPHFSGDLVLSQTKEKVYRLLYSPAVSEAKDTTLLLHIRELDEEIERWRLSIPLNFRPALSASPQTLLAASQTNPRQYVRCFALQLEYLHLMTFVHTTVRKYDADDSQSDGPLDLHSVIHSSYDLSLEAGRSILRCLSLFLSNMPLWSLWSCIHHATNAAISLFLDMIIHPCSSNGSLDLELLISAANTIKSLANRVRTPVEADRVQETGDFFMWLMWLGSCAIAKAKEAPFDLAS
ncbi:putative transcriptional regulatory protein [Colletotrichum fructicola]|nr:putative transcriptional regulatory protein [Colletotrichum fructicola]KAF4936829.1 putative transcriptional regulatory protein [Colletotrichum fructicola]